MSKTYSVRIEDEHLIDWIENNVDNNSDWIRKAMVQRMNLQTDGGNTTLTKDQETAYVWLCDRVNDGGHMNIDSAKNYLAQKTNKNEDLVEGEIIRPLDNKDYINVVSRISDVVVKVNTGAGK